MVIDALRGAAALAVVFHHIAPDGHNVLLEHPGSWLAFLAGLLVFSGSHGVALFFVISGFCIHMRRARDLSAGRTGEVSFTGFWKRRFRRLYPPYAAAMAVYLVILAFQPGRPEAPHGGSFGLYDVLAHVFMIHNFDSRIYFSICSVFWSLAVEEQLYLAYFLLLALRSRLSWGVTLAVCICARGAWRLLCILISREFHFSIPVDEGAAAAWWSWALGAVSVEAATGLTRLPACCYDLRLAVVSLLSSVGLEFLLRFHNSLMFSIGPKGIFAHLCWLLVGPLAGFGFFVLVNRLIHEEGLCSGVRRLPRAVGLLASVGVFSYSLYLVHQLVLVHLSVAVSTAMGVPRGMWFLLLLAPLTIPVAYGFFVIAERPFLSGKRASPAAETSPMAAG